MVFIPADLREQLAAIAAKEGIDVSGLVLEAARLLVESYDAGAMPLTAAAYCRRCWHGRELHDGRVCLGISGHSRCVCLEFVE